MLLWGSVFSAAVISKNQLTVLGSVCRSAHLTEHHRMDFTYVTSQPLRYTRAEAVPRIAAARAHSLTQKPDWFTARPVSTSTTDRTLTPLTSSTTTNPLTTLNQVTACWGCLRVLLFMLYLFEFHWRIVETFMSNAEYTMLSVYAPVMKWEAFVFVFFIFKVMHTKILLDSFLCILLCHVLWSFQCCVTVQYDN